MSYFSKSKLTTSLLTADKLEKLVNAAQNGSKEALQQLCLHFQPLIYKEAHRETVHRCLGEDAENWAWEYFLQLVHSYQGQDYQHLPGYIQLKLHYQLIHLMQKQGRRWDHETAPANLDLLASEKTEEEESLDKIALQQLLHRLQPQDLQLLLFLEQEASQSQIAHKLHCSTRTVQRKLHQLRQTCQRLAS